MTTVAKEKKKRRTGKVSAEEAARLAAVDALYGSLPDLPSVDDYLRAKHAGVDAENAVMNAVLAKKKAKKQ